jgi:hypothetical protein
MENDPRGRNRGGHDDLCAAGGFSKMEIQYFPTRRKYQVKAEITIA